MNLEPVTLRGTRVQLVPLTRGHLDALCDAGLDPRLWELATDPVRTREEMAAYCDESLRGQEEGTVLPFVTQETGEGRIVGSTRLANYVEAHRRVEIGWTWIAPAWQRTGVNTEAKYLMLRHAFEVIGCNRVEFKTDALNARSRTAIARLGAHEEGTLRRHMVTASGRLRDSVYFSIIREEWEGIRTRFERELLR